MIVEDRDGYFIHFENTDLLGCSRFMVAACRADHHVSFLCKDIEEEAT
jgi:hypothetical protein